MAKFVYKMQNILNINEKLETQAENDFAIAAGELRTEEDKLRQLDERRIGYEDKLAVLYTESLKLDEIKETQNAVEIMKYQINIQKISVAKAERKLEDARIMLQEAIKERKTHEKLKEKAFDEYKAEMLSQEGKEIDEIVSYRFGRKES